MLKQFVEEFTKKQIKNVVQIENKFYQVKTELDKISEKIERKPKLKGIYLGEIKDNEFVPSIELIDIISKISDKKIYVNEKAEWMFLNKKDILGKSVTKAKARDGLVLVQNEKDENLGYGEFVEKPKYKDRMVVKNILDRGEYLRIEKD